MTELPINSETGEPEEAEAPNEVHNANFRHEICKGCDIGEAICRQALSCMYQQQQST